ncbi:hypothetical protein [Sinorhizobium fredii]|uniref:hypothetical protein n=1 Tax=Rhizobium fredii TaxID=380 RepID=UPI003511BEBA
MDRWFIIQTRQSVRRLKRLGIDAPALSAILGLVQFAVLIGLFVKIWLIQNHGMSGTMIATLTAFIVLYLVDTVRSIRAQLIAFMALGPGGARKAYLRLVRKTRKNGAVSRLMTLGLAIGAVSAVPDLLQHVGSPAFFEASGVVLVVVADAMRQYCACIVPMT